MTQQSLADDILFSAFSAIQLVARLPMQTSPSDVSPYLTWSDW